MQNVHNAKAELIILFTKMRYDGTTFYWIGYASSQPMGILARMKNEPFPFPVLACLCSHCHGIPMRIPTQWEFHSHAHL